MTLTAPGGLSNSSSKPFSNLFGRIALDNYNIVVANQNPYDYYANQKAKLHMTSNKYPKHKPKSVSEVIKSTTLIH